MKKSDERWKFFRKKNSVALFKIFYGIYNLIFKKGLELYMNGAFIERQETRSDDFSSFDYFLFSLLI